MKKFGMIAALVAALCFALVFVGCSGGDGAPFIPSGGDMLGGKKAAVISFATSEVDKLTSDGAFTNELSNSGDGAVRYESANTGAARVDAATGQVTIVAEGTATITATVADSATYYYEQKAASYTLSVYSADLVIPLTIEIKDPSSSGQVTVQKPWSTFKYKFSNSDELHSYTGPINIAAGVSVSFYADGSENPEAYSPSSDKYFMIESNVDCYVYGNIMSLLDSKKFKSLKKIDKRCSFSYLFKTGGTHVFNHPTKDLCLPAKNATSYCYSDMFNGCSNLQRAPKLPATILSDYCYTYMFSGCSELTAAPALPATTLARGCYEGMFNECSKLVTAPELPAMEMAYDCYKTMFLKCKNLKTAPALPATKLDEYCYFQMFVSCIGLTKAPELPATELANDCYNGMFSGCTSLTKTPALNAPILVKNCYYSMFSNCTNLNIVYCFATDISAENCTNMWLSGVAATGMFLRHKKMDSWPKDSASGIPTGWTEYNDY